MKVCSCPRCDFFAMVALDLLALGDVEAAAIVAAEVTIFDESDGEGYADLWQNDAPTVVDSVELN